jgi:ATP-binding cassette subfamily C protein CydC
MKTFLRLLRFLHPFVGEICLSILVGIATIGAGIGMLGTSAYLITFAALHPSIAELQVAIVGVRFFGISRSVFRYLERLISHSVNLKVLSNIRGWFYRNIEPLAPAGLQDYHSGDLLDRVIADIETLQDFFVRVISPFIVAIVVTIVMSLFLGSYAAVLAWILLTGMLLNGFILPAFFMLISRENSRELLSNRAKLSTFMLEYFQGLEDLQASDTQDQWQKKIRDSNQALSSAQIKNGVLSGFNDALVLLIANGTALAIFIASIPLVNNGLISGVSLAVVVLLTMASFEATNPLPLAAQNLMASLAAGQRLFEVVKTNTFDQEERQSIPTYIKIDRVEVKGVGFHYPNSEEVVLKDIDLILQKGDRIALVGPSGAGKTTLIEMLLGFWKPQKGQVKYLSVNQTFDNPIQHGDIFGVVSENSYLFSESLRENLLLAKPVATDNELIEVIKRVKLFGWYETLPNGLDTWLGERGQQMSGGERQRLALARVLLNDSPFIILDEPTSHLDSETAHTIMYDLLSNLKSKGILLITHQMEFLDDLEKIYFIKDGSVSESGSKNELLTHQGDFYHFYHLQDNLLDK